MPKIKFRPDKKVEYTTDSGTTSLLSKEEYAALRGNRAKPGTYQQDSPQVQDIKTQQAKIAQEKADLDLEKQLREKARIEQKTAEIKAKIQLENLTPEQRKAVGEIGKEVLTPQEQEQAMAQQRTGVENKVFNAQGELVSGERGMFTGTKEGTIPREVGGVLAAGGALAATGAGVQAVKGGVLAQDLLTPATLLKGNVAKSSGLTKLFSVAGIVGFIAGDVRQDVKTANKAFTTSKTNLNNIVNAANRGEITPLEAVDMYNKELANIRIQKSTLTAMTTTWTGRQLSNAMDELEGMEAFDRNRPILDAQLKAAILSPNPTLQLNPEAITLE